MTDAHTMSEPQTTGVTPDFKALVDAVIAAGYTCQTVLIRLDKQIAASPPGDGRDRLQDFRRQLVERMNSAA